jgi:phage baseplate assembly protein V
VLVLCPGGDPANAVALRGIYSDGAPAPRSSAAVHTRVFPDGAVIEYDHVAHGLTATLPEGGTVLLIAPQSVEVHTTMATIVAEQLVKIDAPRTELTGDLQVAGKIDAVLSITTPADVKAGDISLKAHKHMEQGDGKPTGGAIT